MCKMAIEAQKSRSPYVQHVLLELLPRLAAFDDSGTFNDNYLDQTVEYVLGFVNKDREKGRAFLALGLLALISKNAIKRHVPRIVQVVRASLPPPPTAVKYDSTFSSFSNPHNSGRKVGRQSIRPYSFVSRCSYGRLSTKSNRRSRNCFDRCSPAI